MMIETDENGKNILLCTEKEYSCSVCGSTEFPMFYCELYKKLYCMPCTIGKNGCSPYREHTDHKIHEVQYERE